jgi:hypothetical protein
MSLGEARTSRTFKVFSADIALTETHTSAISTVHAEDLYLSEIHTRLTTKEAYPENLYISETSSSETDKVFSNDLYLLEAQTSDIYSVHSENMWFSELETKKTSFVGYPENVFLQETMFKTITKPFPAEDMYLSEISSLKSKLVASENVWLQEAFSYEHHAESIRSFERPFITKIISIPVMTHVTGFAGKGGHA